jgi:hypothetical protein
MQAGLRNIALFQLLIRKSAQNPLHFGILFGVNS